MTDTKNTKLALQHEQDLHALQHEQDLLVLTQLKVPDDDTPTNRGDYIVHSACTNTYFPGNMCTGNCHEAHRQMKM